MSGRSNTRAVPLSYMATGTQTHICVTPNWIIDRSSRTCPTIEDDAATRGRTHELRTGLGEPELALVVSQHLVSLDVANRDLKVVADGKAVGGAGVF